MIEKLFVCVYIWIAQNFPVLYTYSILLSHKLTVSTAPTNVTTPAGLGHRCCNRSVLLEEKEKNETKKTPPVNCDVHAWFLAPKNVFPQFHVFHFHPVFKSLFYIL